MKENSLVGFNGYPYINNNIHTHNADTIDITKLALDKNFLNFDVQSFSLLQGIE
jgi:hypothetical protein